MRMPWKNKTGLAKAAAILTTILSIATVSCGVNWVLAFTANDLHSVLGAFEVVSYVQVGVIAASLLGLLVVLVIWLGSKGRNTNKRNSND
jgi:hypothetical protein